MAAREPDEATLRALGVSRDADDAAVKNAYRALALRYHPDRNPGDPAAAARFDEVNRAYAAWLAARTGAPAPIPGGAPAPPAVPFNDVESIFSQFQSAFGDFFGASAAGGSPGGAPGEPPRGRDRSQPLQLSYPEARDGCTRRVDVLREVICGACRGTGSRDGATRICARCHGVKQLVSTQGMLRIARVCPDCNGTGRYVLEPCESCEQGMRPAAESVEVKVPPGVENGTHLRLAGKGDEHADGGEPGDLYLAIEVDLLDALVTRGDDVVIETRVGGRHVLFGGPLDVRGLDGTLTVQVPRGVRHGDSVRVPSRGHVRPGGVGPGASGDPYRDVARGDQIVVFRVPPDAERAKRTAVAFGAAVLAVLFAIAMTLLR